ncbi:MAG: type II toxin-antitoxin system VapC family toxin [Micropepsaceae bacterium]
MILLDTHCLIWADLQPSKLGVRARRKIDFASRRGELAVSSVTFFEAGLLEQCDRIELAKGVRDWRSKLLERGIRELVLDGGIATRAVEVQLGDPFDRIVVATALEHKCPLISADAEILEWRGALTRFDAQR